MIDAFESNRRPLVFSRVGGSVVMFFLIGLLLTRYMSRDGMGRSKWLRTQVALLFFMLLMMAFSKALLLFTPLSFEALPVAAVPLLASMLLGRRLAFPAALSSALVISALVNFDVQALFIFLVAGVATVTAANTFKKRFFTLFRSGAFVALVILTGTVLTTLLFSGTLDIYEDLGDHLNPINSIWIASLYGGVGSAIIAMILMPFMGLAVGEATRSVLIDMLELDHPLLKKIKDKAPSTWEHSRAMANLGEAAAHAINGNAMLVRVGAYFHDVGKSLNPNLFIENQKGSNPHDELAPYDSARAIFSHVTEGVKLLRKNGVPEDIVAFAYSHHGTSILEYFWMKNSALGNPENFTEQDFSYPGHKPASRETAILMIVDAVEAAARTVGKPDKKKFASLVQNIVFGKMSQGQFDESALTMLDLRIVINTVVDTLVSMYHERIKYPWQNEDNAGSKDAADDSAGSGSKEETPVEQKEIINNTTGNIVTVAPVVNAVSDISKDNNKTVPEDTPEETTFTGPAPVPETDSQSDIPMVTAKK
jgi:putative nucleotidyltransferase with HDIG domain